MDKEWEYTIEVLIVLLNLAKLDAKGLSIKNISPPGGSTSKKVEMFQIFVFTKFYTLYDIAKSIIPLYIWMKFVLIHAKIPNYLYDTNILKEKQKVYLYNS